MYWSIQGFPLLVIFVEVATLPVLSFVRSGRRPLRSRVVPVCRMDLPGPVALWPGRLQ